MLCVLTEIVYRFEVDTDADKSAKSPLKSAKSLSRSLSKSLSFKKSQHDLEKQQAIFERYPGAFSLQIMQADGEPCKNKKGHNSVIFLHVGKTSQPPDFEAGASTNGERQDGYTLGKDTSAGPSATCADEGKRLQDETKVMREVTRQEAEMVARFQKSGRLSGPLDTDDKLHPTCAMAGRGHAVKTAARARE